MPPLPSLKLPAVFSDHAVVQHSRNLPLWGWCAPGGRVEIAFRGTHVSAMADGNGRFSAQVPSQTPGGPFEMVFQCGDEQIVLHDILVGEVWLCSGQSNMEFPLRDSQEAQGHIAQARHHRIRLLQLPQTAAKAPAEDIEARWCGCTPESAADFSAVAFFFGKHLHQALDTPIGLIQSSWNGTPCEAWTSTEALSEDAALEYLVRSGAAVGPHEDPGISLEASRWMAKEIDQSSWQTMEIPQAWESTGLNIDGAVWFRKTIEIPERWAGRELFLSLDSLDDLDQTFFNGQLVGATGKETPSWWAHPRKYTVPAEQVRAGASVIATRIFDCWGNGGFTGKACHIFIAPKDELDDRIELAGPWLYRIELALEPRFADSAVKPSALYNGMIFPLAPFPIAGAIWYQGESNVDRASEYRRLFPAMINCWRASWGEDFSFLFVLLAGWRAHAMEPTESKIAELRDAQLSALALPRTAAASAVDLGDVEDIHPLNKQDVGKRLALAALAQHYGQNVEGNGPTPEMVELTGEGATLRFSHAKGLHARGDEPRGFAVAGEDGAFEWAKACIEESEVKLSHPRGLPIRYIRYAWSDNPLGNLYNAAGLPMVPFRTDGRAYVTAPPAEVYGRLG